MNEKNTPDFKVIEGAKRQDKYLRSLLGREPGTPRWVSSQGIRRCKVRHFVHRRIKEDSLTILEKLHLRCSFLRKIDLFGIVKRLIQEYRMHLEENISDFYKHELDPTFGVEIRKIVALNLDLLGHKISRLEPITKEDLHGTAFDTIVRQMYFRKHPMRIK